METYLDCIPCFYRQALQAARLAGADVDKQKIILDRVAEVINRTALNVPPPILAKEVYSTVNQVTGESDPFKKIKKASNEEAMNLYGRLVKVVKDSEDPLLTSTKLAIAGNVIDFGASGEFDIEMEIEGVLNKKFEIRDYYKFKEEIEKSRKILYIGDNAGEIVFDKILIEHIMDNKEIVFAVREKPAINDALVEDAKMCGLDEICEVISSGSDVPGTPLEICSNRFLKEYENSDIIISKGQGNLETLIGENGAIFFMLKVKCLVMANKLDCNVNDIILKKHNKR